MIWPEALDFPSTTLTGARRRWLRRQKMGGATSSVEDGGSGILRTARRQQREREISCLSLGSPEGQPRTCHAPVSRRGCAFEGRGLSQLAAIGCVVALARRSGSGCRSGNARSVGGVLGW